MIEGDGVGAPAGAPPTREAQRAHLEEHLQRLTADPEYRAEDEARRERFAKAASEWADERCTCAAWSPGECCCDYDWETR